MSTAECEALLDKLQALVLQYKPADPQQFIYQCLKHPHIANYLTQQQQQQQHNILVADLTDHTTIQRIVIGHEANEHDKQRLHEIIRRGDNLTTLLTMFNVMLAGLEEEIYIVENALDGFDFVKLHKESDPYILVTIGAGVSIFNVSNNQCSRISGSTLGHGTFLGLASLLSKCKGITFEDAVNMADTGDSENVDMLVGDIYGGDYTKFGLKANRTASSVGKLINSSEDVSSPDVLASLLRMIGVNIALLSYLCAMDQGLNKIIFASKVRGPSKTRGALAFTVDFAYLKKVFNP